MSKLVRLVIALSLVLGMLFLAGGAAWAGPVGDSGQALEVVDVVSGPALRDDYRGTVHPPKPRIWVCDEGVFSLGGVATLSVDNLAPYYCIRAHLWNFRWPPAHVPPGTGKFLANITFIQVYYKGRFVKHLPLEDGQAELCYAVPPGKGAKIYFLDAYKGKGKPGWKALATSMKDGLACAPAQDSGAYALIGK
jgi:hypothetical protein